MTLEMISTLHDEVEKGNLLLEEAQEKVKEAVLGEKDPSGIRPINPNIDLGENGYIFIFGHDGDMIAHPYIDGNNVCEEEVDLRIMLATGNIYTIHADSYLVDCHCMYSNIEYL